MNNNKKVNYLRVTSGWYKNQDDPSQQLFKITAVLGLKEDLDLQISTIDIPYDWAMGEGLEKALETAWKQTKKYLLSEFRKKENLDKTR